MRVNRNVEEFYKRLQNSNTNMNRCIKKAIIPSEELSAPLSIREESGEFAPGILWGKFQDNALNRLNSIEVWMEDIQKTPDLSIDRVPEMIETVQDVIDYLYVLWHQTMAVKYDEFKK